MGQQHITTAYEKQLVSLERVLQTIREEENAEVLIETTINYLQSEFEYRLIWIGLYDRLEHRLFGKGGITPNGNDSFLKQRFFLNPGDLLEQVVIQQRPVAVSDLREEARAGEWRRAAQEFGIQGTLLFPLRCKDMCFGVAILGSHLWGISPRVTDKAQLSLLFGGLATALYQIEMNWQRSSTKRPDQPLFQLLDQMLKLPTLQQRLEVVVDMTHEFVEPTRTNLYWFEPAKRYFWHRVGNRQTVRSMGSAQTTAAGITVSEVSDFYQALVDGQLVSIGSGKSPLKADVTGRLLGRLKARSVLAAPIRVREELVGFLAAEGMEARIWEEGEKNYVRAAAQMVGLVAGSEQAEEALQQTQQDTRLVAEIAGIFTGKAETPVALKQCAELLLERLRVERFILFKKDANGDYTVIYQQQPLNRAILRNSLTALEPSDRTVLEENASSIAIEDWEEDKRLGPWIKALTPLGMRSLLVCRTGDTYSEGLLLVAHQNPRTWNRHEIHLAGVVSQQVGQLLHSLRLQSLAEYSSNAQQTLQAGLNTLLNAPQDPELFERAFMTFLASLLSCPLVALLTFPNNEQSKDSKFRFSPLIVADPSLEITTDIPLRINQDVLIQEAIRSRSLIGRRVADLQKGMYGWLEKSGIGQLLVMALPDFSVGPIVENPEPKDSTVVQNRDYEIATSTDLTTATESRSNPQQQLKKSQNPISVLILGDQPARRWALHLIPVVETLVRQFAYLRYYHRLSTGLDTHVKDLEQLNWYKHRCLETLHQSIAGSLSRLMEQDSLDTSNTGGETKNNEASLRHLGRSQLLHQIENSLQSIRPLLSEEQWQSTLNLTSIQLANLLKRSLAKLAPLTNARHLSVNVHNPGNLSIYADRLKLEAVLFELLLTSCYRTQPNSKIDLWCYKSQAQAIAPHESQVRELSASDRLERDKTLMELLITDNITLDITNVERQNINEEPLDLLNLLVNPTVEAPNRQLKICQRVVRSWGGDLLFYQLENGRLISRLLLEVSN